MKTWNLWILRDPSVFSFASQFEELTPSTRKLKELSFWEIGWGSLIITPFSLNIRNHKIQALDNFSGFLSNSRQNTIYVSILSHIGWSNGSTFQHLMWIYNFRHYHWDQLLFFLGHSRWQGFILDTLSLSLFVVLGSFIFLASAMWSSIWKKISNL